MTSPAEQMFLFGEIIDPEPISCLALFGYIDLTAGSAIIFATITISAYITSDWQVLSFWISAILTAVVRPTRAVVVGISWLLMQFAAVQSLADIFTTLRNLEDGVKSRIIESRLSHLLSAAVNWYFPFNRPDNTWHVSGLVMAVSSPEEELSYHCFEVFGRLEQGRLNRREWLEEAVFCFGQETGLELRAIIRDDWQLPHLIEGEIHHLYVLAFVITTVSCVILAALSWYALAKAVSSRRADKLQPAALRVDSAGHETQLRGTPPTPSEIHLWNMIDQCEGVIAKQKGLLIAKIEELREVTQRVEDGWALVKKLSARPIPVDETRPHETTVVVELRQELAVKEGQLSIAHGKLRQTKDNAIVKERFLYEQVAQLEQQLAREKEQAEADSLSEYQSLRAELQARNDQPGSRTALVALNQELMAQCQAFQVEHDRLQLQFRDFSVTIQERDAALGRVILLETELATTQSSMESAVWQAQDSLARAHEADVALQQSMSNLQNTCDLTLAQERATADQAQKRASDLTAEVNDLQASHSAQEIPKRPSRDVGSISTALAQSQVTVSQQQAEINDLRRQLGEIKQGFMWPSEQVAQEGVQKLREALSKEKRARTEINIRWSKKMRELEDECQKLRISLSNAVASTPVHCQGNRRPPTIP
ncbi:hypothetical protein BDV40DRAFT_303012 [Aspergillus tamarii]|uniref:Integral membrane protein n=1 Tax=Aspergillus tamarii TaxID=41984 RepID=A0A5N6ULZ3_ASPTM|nr:hypothetical protein BDV40DRAFT_303012 [Aspergillus tamarii]